MPSLEIRRDSGYADRLRAYEVVIDQSVVGDIRDGEVRRFPVSCGEHNLRIKISWCGSNPVNFVIGESEVAIFRAESGLRGKRIIGALWCALIAWNSWIKLSRVSRDE